MVGFVASLKCESLPPNDLNRLNIQPVLDFDPGWLGVTIYT